MKQIYKYSSRLLMLTMLAIISFGTVAAQQTIPKEGDVYGGGVVVHYNEETKQVLIISPKATAHCVWEEAVEWANDHDREGFADWHLPTPAELYILAEKGRDHNNSAFQKTLKQMEPLTQGDVHFQIDYKDHRHIVYSYWSSASWNVNGEAAVVTPFESSDSFGEDKTHRSLGETTINEERPLLSRAVRVVSLAEVPALPLELNSAGINSIGDKAVIANTVAIGNDNLDIYADNATVSKNATDGGKNADFTVKEEDFVDYTNGNYRPEVDALVSVLSNNGDISKIGANYLLDLDGNDRLVDSKVDLGAYQTTMAASVELVMAITIADRVYDKTTDVAATDITWGTPAVVGGHLVEYDTENAVAKYDNANAGVDKTVTITGLKLKGRDAVKYKLPSPLTVKATITKADHVITYPADADPIVVLEGSKPFDTNVTVTPELELPLIYSSSDESLATIAADGKITLVATSGGTFTITVTQEESENYNPQTVTQDYVITALVPITVGLTIADKEYDGDDNAEVTWGTIPNIVPGDVVAYDFSAVVSKFDNATAGVNKPVTITGLKLKGADAFKYKLVPLGLLTATIHKAPLELSFKDGSTNRIEKLRSDDPFDTEVTINPILDDNIAYVSDKPNLATVDASGIVTIKGIEGDFTITASYAETENYLSAIASQDYYIKDNGSPVADILSLKVNDENITVEENMYIEIDVDADLAKIDLITDPNAIVSKNGVVVNTNELIEEWMNEPKLMLQTFEFVIQAQNLIEENTRKYTLTLEKRFKFESVVRTRMNNILNVINNADNNGYHCKFTSFRWFKNGAEVSTEQYYTAGENGEFLNASDIYYVELKVSGFDGILRTTEGKPQLSSVNVRAYPNPVNRYEKVYVDTDMPTEALDGAVIDVYSLAGIRINQINVTGKLTQVDMSKAAAGLHIFKLRFKDGSSKDLRIVVQ